MSSKTRSLTMLACACLAVVPGAFVLAQNGEPPMELPPGWTMEDMEACVVAGTPGEMHEHLKKAVGVWTGTNEMRMAPGMEPVTTKAKWTMTSILDGRYVACEAEGDMPGMGPYHGRGVFGYDNVAQEFVCDWIDNMSTGIMRGTGELSADGKAITWTYEYTCPINKTPTTLREVQRFTSDTTMTVAMTCTDPKSGEEYECMRFELKKGA